MHTLTLMITHSKMSRLILRAFCRAPWTVNFTRTNAIPSASQRNLSTDEHKEEVLIPEYQPRVGEEVEVKRARLLYQSRKRGMLENGLLLSSFADKYLSTFSPNQLDQYDHLINTPSNDWQLYYWITGREETPNDYNNKVMDLIKKHTKNGNLGT